MEGFELTSYLSNGVDRMIRDMLKVSLKYPQQSLFIMHYAAAQKKARALREQSENDGVHIPPFLIASITRQCNLHCKGCYAATCSTHSGMKELSGQEWGDIFSQAEALGVGFILLAGGEPLTRMDVLREAGRHRDLLFPVFTNGTMLTHDYLKLFSSSRNLLPVLSIEGGRMITDARRGAGVHAKLMEAMEALNHAGVLFGASVTVTRENINEVTSGKFVRELYANSCKAVIYVEYVPVDRETAALAFDDADRRIFESRVKKLRRYQEQLMFLMFPGDEKSSGGCLAAGRGFFHINAGGGAEPCPFSAYSDTSVLHTGLRAALSSPLFMHLQTSGMLDGEHNGGCVLFEQEQLIKTYIGGQ